MLYINGWEKRKNKIIVIDRLQVFLMIALAVVGFITDFMNWCTLPCVCAGAICLNDCLTCYCKYSSSMQALLGVQATVGGLSTVCLSIAASINKASVLGVNVAR